MPRFAANLSMMFTEWDFLDRFQAARDAGFDAVEYLFPYDHDPDAIARALARSGVTQALFNAPPGDWAGGERGLATLAGREAEFDQGLQTAALYVQATGVTQLHVMAGLADAADPGARARYRDSLRRAVEVMAPLGVTVLIEPINPISMPGYFLNDFDLAAGILADPALTGAALQFDAFHSGMMGRDTLADLDRLLPLTAHVQIAGVPDRHEPVEPLFSALFQRLDASGYAGVIGCEYLPRAGTLAGLDWYASWRR